MPLASYPGRDGTGARAAMRLTFTRAERESVAAHEARVRDHVPFRVLRAAAPDDLNTEETEQHEPSERS